MDELRKEESPMVSQSRTEIRQGEREDLWTPRLIVAGIAVTVIAVAIEIYLYRDLKKS